MALNLIGTQSGSAELEGFVHKIPWIKERSKPTNNFIFQKLFGI